MPFASEPAASTSTAERPTIRCEIDDDVLVRLAGFPFAPLLALATELDPSPLAEREARRDEVRQAALAALRAIRFEGLSAETRAAVRDAQRAVAKGARVDDAAIEEVRQAGVDLRAALAPLAALDQELNALRDRLAEAEREALRRGRALLRDWARRPAFQEAVLLQSPSALIGIEQLAKTPAEATDSMTRQREHLATLFLQRLCAKNDTHSFFGPTAALCWNGEPGPFRVEPQLQRRTYLSHWGVRELARCWARALPQLARGQVNPTLRETPDGHLWQTLTHEGAGMLRRRYRRARLYPETLEALHAAAAGAADDAAELEEAGLLREFPCPLPSGLFHPDAWLAAALDALPPSPDRERALELLRTLTDNVERFTTAELHDRRALLEQLERTFETVTGAKARRGQGGHYADRMLLHEECGASVRGHPATREARAQLEAILPLLAGISFLSVAPERARVRAWFAQRFRPGERVPLIEVERALDEGAAREVHSPELDAIAAVEERVRRCLARAIDEAPPSGSATVDAAELADALAALPWTGLDAAYLSLDVMLAARGAAVTPLVGECHGILAPQTFLFDALPEADALLARRRGRLREAIPRGEVTEIVFRHTQKTDARHPLGALDLELGGRSPRPPEEVVRHAEVEVFLDEAGVLRLESPRGELVPLVTTFYYPLFHLLSPVPPAQNDAADKFFPPRLLPKAARTGSCPRLVLGGVVIRRASFVAAAADVATALGGPDGALAGAGRLGRRLGLPRWCFAQIPGEPKPVYVDLQSPLLIEALRRLCARADRSASVTSASVTFSEMLPGPDELLLDSPEGKRTFELRMRVFIRPERAAQAAPALG